MKNFSLIIGLIMCSLWIASCGNPSTEISKETPTKNVEQTSSEITQNNSKEPAVRATSTENLSKSDSTDKPTNTQPTIGTVKELVNGDLLCYATLTDEQGIEHNVGASFEICAESEKYLNKKVRTSYTVESVSDCQSAEPCGKTKKESIITKMEVLDETSSKQPQSSKLQTLSNGEWTITLGNTDSWSGVNGTGNVTYKGCDSKGSCLELTGGKITCRDGKCVTVWSNRDYTYVLEQPITGDENNPQKTASSTILTVRKGSKVILNAQGFKPVSAN